MANTFKVGDHVTWNSEAGHVSGRIVKVHTENVDYKGYVHHASKEEPQYEIKSDKTDHIALHKSAALKLLRRWSATFELSLLRRVPEKSNHEPL
jgi:hypothetical protein